jgi:hypothetical protein
MKLVRAAMVSVVAAAVVLGAGWGSKADSDITTADETIVDGREPAPPTSVPPTTDPPPTDEPVPPITLPPGKVPCMILYGTLLPGGEKDVPVYRTDRPTPEQIATIHLPDEVWTPAEAEDLCA